MRRSSSNAVLNNPDRRGTAAARERLLTTPLPRKKPQKEKPQKRKQQKRKQQKRKPQKKHDSKMVGEKRRKRMKRRRRGRLSKTVQQRIYQSIW